jgi:hypothetical protein
MTWFSVWLPLILQCVVPIGLVCWLHMSRTASRARFVAVAVFVASYLAAIGMAGLWLVLPWFLPMAFATVLLLVVALAWRRLGQAPRWPSTVSGHLSVWLLVAAAVGMAGVTVAAAGSRRFPVEPIDLTFPLGSGTYLVVNGGSRLLVNAHLGTREQGRLAAYRGQSYGLDLVRIDHLGRRAGGLLPSDPRAYAIFDDPVFAPCTGKVIAAQDGLEDMRPPAVDRAHMAGNHAIIECGGAWVVLGHLRKASVLVHAGQTVEAGQRIGHVGNSGNSGEPHLHIHAQRPGPTDALLGGAPVPIRLSGRDLVRNDRVRAAR